MSTIVTRSGKGSPLTHNEVDANFTNLNTDKYQSGDAATFTTLTATGQTSLGGAAGSEGLRVNVRASATDYVQISGGTSGTAGVYIASAGVGSAPNLYISSNASGSIRFYSNTVTNEQMRVSHTASAVNYVQVTGATTGNGVTLSSQGSDANINMFYTTKGTGGHVFYTNAGVNGRQFDILHTTNAVNRATVTGSATNFEPVWGVAGSDTNISMAFQSKGTGGISLSTGSTGTNLVNGTTVTALTVTNNGSGYSSTASAAISAPTTAGGVQATATCEMRGAGAITVSGGGTGYSLNDTLTVVGGTFTTAQQLTVTGVSGGVITSVSFANTSNYTVCPTMPVSVTGGTGSGATFSFSFGVRSLTITNAGSGYVEQPTVTFSGGGGSGAAAYATVGSGTVVKSLGTTFDIYTPNSSSVPAFRVSDSGGADSYFRSYAPAGGVNLVAQGATNANADLGSNGTGSIYFTTNGTSLVTQMRVVHTASAVNYVQVTGAATGNAPTFSAQGSDTNIPLAINAKGNSAIRLGSNNTDYLAVNTATTGLPILQAIGGSTNIDIQFLPKGTGLVRFGTRTASADAPITGYIEIKDSGGTTRRLAVIG